MRKLCDIRELYDFKVDSSQQNYIVVYYEFRKSIGFYSVIDKITQRKAKLERILEN